MIFYWLSKSIRWLMWLIIYPKPIVIARIEPNDKCPVCGHSNGEIRCVEKLMGAERVPATLIQHRCKVCGGRRYESPVVKVNPKFVHPAVARDEIEAKEDFQEAMVNSERRSTSGK